MKRNLGERFLLTDDTRGPRTRVTGTMNTPTRSPTLRTRLNTPARGPATAPTCLSPSALTSPSLPRSSPAAGSARRSDRVRTPGLRMRSQRRSMASSSSRDQGLPRMLATCTKPPTTPGTLQAMYKRTEATMPVQGSSSAPHASRSATDARRTHEAA